MLMLAPDDESAGGEPVVDDAETHSAANPNFSDDDPVNNVDVDPADDEPDGEPVVDDPENNDFLTSGPGVAATLKIQHAFGEEHNLEACKQILQTFARSGGDNGATDKYIHIYTDHNRAAS